MYIEITIAVTFIGLNHYYENNVTFNSCIYLFTYLFGVLRRFQHYTGHITMSSFVGRGNQFIQLVKVLDWDSQKVLSLGNFFA